MLTCVMLLVFVSVSGNSDQKIGCSFIRFFFAKNWDVSRGLGKRRETSSQPRDMLVYHENSSFAGSTLDTYLFWKEPWRLSSERFDCQRQIDSKCRRDGVQKIDSSNNIYESSRITWSTFLQRCTTTLETSPKLSMQWLTRKKIEIVTLA